MAYILFCIYEDCLAVSETFTVIILLQASQWETGKQDMVRLFLKVLLYILVEAVFRPVFFLRIVFNLSR